MTLASFLLLLCFLIPHPSQAGVSYRAAASGSSASSIVYAGAGTYASAANGNVTPGYPSGWQVGDLLLCILETRDNVGSTMPAGWAVLSAANSGAAHRATIFWKFAALGDNTTPTVTHTGGNSISAQIIGFTGVNTTTPFDVANSFTVSGADLTTEAAAINTPTAGTMLVFTAHMADNHTTLGTPAGSAPWTQAFFNATGSGSDSSIGAYYGWRTAAGVQPAVTATRTGAANAISHGAQIALRPAATRPLVIPKPTGTLRGDVMFASVSVTPSTVTINPPVGWTLIRQITQNAATSSKMATYYRVAGVGEPATYTWTFSGASHNGAVGGIASFSGVDNITPYDAEDGNATGSGTTHTAPTVTTTQSDGMLVTIHELTSSRTWTFPGGMNEVVDVSSLPPSADAGISMEINYEVRPTAGPTGTRTATVGGHGDSGAVQSLSIKPSPLVCFNDDFNLPNGPPSSDWVVSHVSGSFGDPKIVNFRLRLTDASIQAATRATLQRLFPGAGNRIEVEFDHFAYGGNGADGIALTLSDSAVPAVAGAFGGSLGYAQKSNPGSDCTVPGGCPGFAGGWLGVGIDEYGNFSNPSEGRVGGPGRILDSVSIRGSGSGAGATYGGGLPNYSFHTGTGTLAPPIDVGGATPGPGYRYRVIVDHANGVNAMVSVERNTGTGFTTLIPPYDAKAIAGQAAVPTNWLLSYTGSTGGAINIHEIDNLRVCATSVTPISGIHHFEISVATSASTCTSQSVTITAKDISNNTLNGYTGTISITTSTSNGDWALVSGGGTFSNGTADDGVASYSFVAGDNGSITLNFTNTHADDLTINVTDVTVPSSSTTSATVRFRDSAFVVTPDPIQIAGRPQAMTVALYTRVGGSCGPDTNYTGNRNLDTWLTLDPSHPASATVPTIGALTLPTSEPTSNPTSNNLALTFASGAASFAMNTTDVGRYVLNIRDDTRLYATAVDLGGASGSITTRPWLHVAVPGNLGNNASTGSIFTSAGTDFTTTVRAVLWQSVDDDNVVGGDGIPDSDADLADNTVAQRFAWDTVLSSVAPFTPATPVDTPPGTGTAGTLDRSVSPGGSTIPQASFMTVSPPIVPTGTATTTDWRYSEVGSFTLRATASNYLNSGINVVTDNGVVGRFTPAFFNLVLSHGCPSGVPANNFTYSGQPFRVTVTAFNALATPGITQNFDRALGFAKDVTLSDVNGATNCPSPAVCFANNVITNAAAPDGFAAGTGSTYVVTNLLTGPKPPMIYTLPLPKETVPVTLTLRATDTDGVNSSSIAEPTAPIRSGRLRIINAYGSELAALPVPLRVEYFSTDGWITNAADTCTTLSLPNLTLTNTVHAPPPGPGQGVGTITIKNTNTTTVTVVSPSSGAGELSMTAPLAEGFTDARMDLSARQWLRYDWDGDNTEEDPTGRGTFGLFRGSPRHIYLRERY